MTARLISLITALIGLSASGHAQPPLDLRLVPVTPGPALIRVTEGGLVISFANACLADAGVMMTLLSAQGYDDVLLVETPPIEQGCPEIFQPVRAFVALPSNVVVGPDRIIARRPAEGQPIGPKGPPVMAELRRLALPVIDWSSATEGTLGLSMSCEVMTIEARVLPDAVSPFAQPHGFVAAPPECLDAGAFRAFRLDTARPEAMLNPVRP